MRYAHSVEDVRAAESALMARLPDGALMQRAAAGLASHCLRLLSGLYGARVVLLVGAGNNGGDALYAGARLAARGAAVRAVLLDAERVHQPGLGALRLAGGRVSADALRDIAAADLVVDGLLGIGGHGALRPPAAELAAQTARSGAVVVAVDVPSGVDADTGEVAGAAVRADVTVTFGTHKPGLLVDPGASYAGLVELVDIGLASSGELPAPVLEALQSVDVALLAPRPDAASDKYSRGVVGVAAGSGRYTGAAVLAAGGAVRGGAGMVRVVTEGTVAALVRQAWPEVVVTELAPGGDPRAAGRVQAWVTGPGGGTDTGARERLAALLDTDLPVLIDADALTVLVDIGGLPGGSREQTLLTPHAGELARLLGVDRDDVDASRLTMVRRAADELGATVLLKGSTTLVADPGDGSPVRVNPTGTPWLAAAGTGDVLAGLAGALLAGGLAARDAGSAAAYLHGLAARIAAESGPPSATDVLAALPLARAAVDA